MIETFRAEVAQVHPHSAHAKQIHTLYLKTLESLRESPADTILRLLQR